MTPAWPICSSDLKSHYYTVDTFLCFDILWHFEDTVEFSRPVVPNVLFLLLPYKSHIILFPHHKSQKNKCRNEHCKRRTVSWELLQHNKLTGSDFQSGPGTRWRQFWDWQVCVMNMDKNMDKTLMYVMILT